MHRSIAYVGVGTLLLAFALIAFPIWAYGSEQFDLEQEFGILILPAGLLVLLVAGVSPDPRLTTVGGTFGNPEFAGRERPARSSASVPGRLTYHPREAVNCEQCGTVVSPDLARCPRCTRARMCRTCGRPLGYVLDRPTCPRGAKAEPFCDCPQLPRKAGPSTRARSRVAGRP
jgi:hypothetical protein